MPTFIERIVRALPRRIPAPARRTAPVLVALLALAALAVPAAAQDDQAADARTVTLRFTLGGDAADQRFHTAGPNGELTYGTGRLTGTSVMDGQPVDVELLASIEYHEGSGPFDGWITISDAAGDLLGLRYEGFVTQRGELTTIDGTVSVAGGAGAWVDASGAGRITGRRDGALGDDASYTLVLTLSGMPPATAPSVFADPQASGVDLYRAYGDLVIAKDAAGLEAALDPAYRIVRSDGSSATREEYIANLPELRSFSVADPRELRTEDTITLFVTVQTDLMVDGKPFSRDPAPVLLSFHWDGTRWTVVSHANFNAPEAS